MPNGIDFGKAFALKKSRLQGEPLTSVLTGRLGCWPGITFLQMLDHGPNRIEAAAADRSTTWNAHHLLHLLGQSTKETALRFLTKLR